MQEFIRSRPGILSYGAVVVDVTGDGLKDLVTSGRWSSPRIWAGDGRGSFRPEPIQNVPQMPPTDLPRVVTFDADRDGDQDLFVVNGGSGVFPIADRQDRLWLNDGRGVFVDATAARLPVENHLGWGVAVGDFDRDGDLDIVVASGARDGWLFYVNNGNGYFREENALRLPNIAAFTYTVAAADVDSDGDLDLVAGAYGDPSGPNADSVKLCLNDGRGFFIDASQQLPSLRTRTQELAFGDIDGDGDLDLVVGCGAPNTLELHQNKIYVNDGTGTFTDESVQRFANQPQRSFTGAIAFIDVDGDGDVDLFEGALPQPMTFFPNRLWLNDGRGYFRDVTGVQIPTLGGATIAGGVTVADLDGDGDDDVYVGTSWPTDTVYWNLRNHIYPPAAPIIGNPYGVDLFGPFAGVNITVLGAVGNPLPVPGLGTWWIDLAVAVPLGPIQLSGLGKGRLVIPVPSDPGLVGLSFRVQSLTLDMSPAARHSFTSAWTERITR